MTEHWLAMLMGTLMMRKSWRQGLWRKGRGHGRSMAAGESWEDVRQKENIQGDICFRVSWTGFQTSYIAGIASPLPSPLLLPPSLQANCFLSSLSFQCHPGMISDKISKQKSTKWRFHSLHAVEKDLPCFLFHHQRYFNDSVGDIRQTVEKKWNGATGSAEILDGNTESCERTGGSLSSCWTRSLKWEKLLEKFFYPWYLSLQEMQNRFKWSYYFPPAKMA